jgi:phenylalanyl-tRNA synthetase beta chain
MQVSLSWLKQYVPVDVPVSDLADRLTMAGLEVEGVWDRYRFLDTVRVGRIQQVDPHPNADKLVVCRVDVGTRRLSIVCGAPNAAVGLVSPVALPGTLLPDGLNIAESSIRGQTSQGMLCSARELCIGTEAGGLMALDAALTPGTKLADALGLSDMVLEISLTPNRSDCLSILGIAREVAALTGTRLCRPTVDQNWAGNRIHAMTAVTIEAPEACCRYAARLVTGIRVADSPFWLQDRLRSVGLRPISNLVDITNFVMMETGQPLHAFDFDQLAEHRIVVRRAADGDAFTTLDGKARALDAEMLMICDGKQPVGIAGVMGGLNSQIDPTTTRVLIESACFDPVSIRKTAKKLGLSTDASHRFERGVDPQGTVAAVNRAAELMAQLGGGQIVSGLIDVHPRPASAPVIALNVTATNRYLGTDIDGAQMASLLESIEFAVDMPDKDHLKVTPPSFRVDIGRREDLMEEIARLWGYNRIPTTFPEVSAQAKALSPAIAIKARIRSLMTGFGFTEAINYSFINALWCDRLRFGQTDPRRRLVSILNPLTEDQAVMRTCLIPGLLETLIRNMAQQVRTVRLFEVGKVFIGDPNTELPIETEMVAGIWSGARSELSWHGREVACDFYDIKGIVEGLLSGLKVDTPLFEPLATEACTFTRFGYSARIHVQGVSLGLVGELHPEVLSSVDLKQPAFVFELNLARLSEAMPSARLAKPIPRFPAVSRDITLIVDRDVQAGGILNRVSAMDQPLVEDLRLFDVFDGKPIAAGKKSVSFRITYRSSLETLEDERVNRIHRGITDQLLIDFNAQLPI